MGDALVLKKRYIALRRGSSEFHVYITIAKDKYSTCLLAIGDTCYEQARTYSN